MSLDGEGSTAMEQLPWVEFYTWCVNYCFHSARDSYDIGCCFIHAYCGQIKSHFNTHIQISEEQCIFIDHFLFPHYKDYYYYFCFFLSPFAQCMLVVWAVYDLGKYLLASDVWSSILYFKETNISCYHYSQIHTSFCLLSFLKWTLTPAGVLRKKPW